MEAYFKSPYLFLGHVQQQKHSPEEIKKYFHIYLGGKLIYLVSVTKLQSLFFSSSFSRLLRSRRRFSTILETYFL